MQSSQATAASNHADQDGQAVSNLTADKTKDNNNPNQNQDNSVPQDMSNPNIAGGVSADLATAVAATTKQQNGGTGEIIQTAPNAEQNNIIDPYDYNDGTDTDGSTTSTTYTPLIRNEKHKTIFKSVVSEKFRFFLIFTCILPHYVSHESLKEF